MIAALSEDRPQPEVVASVLGFRSGAPPVNHQVDGLVVPNADYSARCLAIGIGGECHAAVGDLMRAPWFAHLRRTVWAQGGIERLQGLAEPMPHVASLALPSAPTDAEEKLAQRLGTRLRGGGTFVVVTTTCTMLDAAARIGPFSDCIVVGSPGAALHHYPARTVTEPQSGRLIEYDLSDVLCLWAARVGEHGQFRPDADALQVEIAADDPTLKDVDAVAVGFTDQLQHADKLRLVNVVEGGRSTMVTPISFQQSPFVGQGRQGHHFRHRGSCRSSADMPAATMPTEDLRQG